ncbi:MAG: hypothetical protein GQ546_14260 [Gammaproteobacteria bacterium]|nr:hypothetical protein [Gammaproteobacteria bacterium]
MMGDGFNFTMGYGAHWIFWILLLVLFVWLYSVLINRKDIENNSHKGNQSHPTATEILEQRFAEGKINEDEYNRRLAHLHKDVIP